MSDQQQTPLTPTSAKLWRQAREEGVVVEFMPGFSARIRPLTVDVLIRQGKVPSSLGDIVAESFLSGDIDIDVKDPLQVTTDLADFIHEASKEMFMEPRVVDPEMVSDPDNEITPDDIPLFVKGVILRFINKHVEYLRAFRYQSLINVPTVGTTEGNTQAGAPDLPPANQSETPDAGAVGRTTVGRNRLRQRRDNTGAVDRGPSERDGNQDGERQGADRTEIPTERTAEIA